MRLLHILIAALITVSGPLFADDLPVIRAAVLKIGTVNWELATITDNGLDERHGFRLEVLPFADNGAARIALEGGRADMAVADWIWVARQRAAGKDYVVVPYSKAVGGLVVPADSAAQSIADLAGGKIGIAGGPLDKSWLILRAYAQQVHGMDLEAETEQVFGAPPLIFKSALGSDYGGAINYWHFLAKMRAAGMRELISVEKAGRALGLDTDTPLLGYYFKAEFLADNPELAQAFYEASREAKDMLADSDAAWDALRPQMRAETDAEFSQLRADWIAGIPPRGPVDADAARELLQLGATGRPRSRGRRDNGAGWSLRRRAVTRTGYERVPPHAGRLALARAFAGQPELLVMDEPFVSLDPEAARSMLSLTQDLIAEHRPATLFVTHARGEADLLADRILEMRALPQGASLAVPTPGT